MKGLVKKIVLVFALMTVASAYAGGGSGPLCNLYPDLPYCNQ